MTCVIAGRASSRHSNRREVGMGSNSQRFGADFRMKVFTLVSVQVESTKMRKEAVSLGLIQWSEALVFDCPG